MASSNSKLNFLKVVIVSVVLVGGIIGLLQILTPTSPFITDDPIDNGGSTNTTPDDNKDDLNSDQPSITYDADQLTDFAANVRSVLGPDGIPAVENPVFWSVTEANEYLAEQDIIFGFIHNGQAKAYPQRILVWHEIVNEKGGMSITYCPLTGSAVGFFGDLGSETTTYGTSGSLLNSNLVMYDRATNSLFPQILGQGVKGDHFGTKLDKFQLYWTTWENWKTKYPETLVLSTDTGNLRNYNSDPYGSYDSTSSYYQTGNLLFPVMYSDTRLGGKEIVIGIDYLGEQLAVQKTRLLQDIVINSDLENSNIVLFYDEALDVAKVYSRVVDGNLLSFNYAQGNIVDSNGIVWDVDGSSSIGTLTEVVYFDVFYAAWYAFFPGSTLVTI